MRLVAPVVVLDLTYTIKVQQRRNLLKTDKFLSNVAKYRLRGQICHYGTEITVKAYRAQLVEVSAKT
jgi:hypothetical protein